MSVSQRLGYRMKTFSSLWEGMGLACRGHPTLMEAAQEDEDDPDEDDPLSPIQWRQVTQVIMAFPKVFRNAPGTAKG